MMASESVAKLLGEGWIQQFTASGPRLHEAIENYLEIGFEVKTVPVKDLDLEGCTVCFDDESDETVMIFTRKKADR